MNFEHSLISLIESSWIFLPRFLISTIASKKPSGFSFYFSLTFYIFSLSSEADSVYIWITLHVEKSMLYDESLQGTGRYMPWRYIQKMFMYPLPDKGKP